MKILHRLRGEMETPRLLLRRWKPLDFQAFLRFAGDPEVMLPAGSKPAQGLQEAETQFHRALRDEGCYAMVLKGTGEPIGKIKFQEDLRRFRVNSLSIGYELAKPYWGQGYMTEALRAMVQYGFERKGLDVLAISLITNMAAGIQKVKLSEQEVIDTAAARAEVLQGLVEGILARI